MVRRLLMLLVAAGAQSALAQGFAPLRTDEGYSVEKSQSVENAPRGSVGRKTTDREHRVGNTEETDANETTVVFTFGGFARKCPTTDGIVAGTFEYALSYDETNTDDGETQHNHVGRRLLATLEGHVRDDATLDHVVLDGSYMAEVSGTRFPAAREQRPVHVIVRPGSGGEPDWEAMKSAAAMAADVAIAGVVLMAGELLRQAQLEWNKPNECVEFSFDPPSESRSLGPNESAQIRVELRTKADRTPVPWKTEFLGTLNGAGTVSPTRVDVPRDSPAMLTYTAAAEPRRGHGIALGTRSRAGLAEDKWLISNAPDYELHLESRIISRAPEEAAQSTASATVRLTGSTKTSPLYGDERLLHNGSGTISYTTVALPERDACDPAISGSGTAELTIFDAHIDVAAERDSNGTATRGGRAQIELAYGVGLGGGETYNVPFMREFQCVLLPERAEPYFFWTSMYMSSRAEDGQIGFLDKNGWTYVGQNGVVATKTLRGNCGGLCDEEVTTFTLREVDRSQGR
jgi:hypothetical protein